MADKIKISALPNANPLTGDEESPVVQDGVTKKTNINAELTYVNANAQIEESQVTNLVDDLANKQPLSDILTSIADLETDGAIIKSGLSASTLTPVSTNGAPAGGTSNLAARDSGGNSAFNNLLLNIDFPNAIGTPIELDSTSGGIQQFNNGTIDTDILMPDATTLKPEWLYKVCNLTTATIFVKSKIGGPICTLSPGFKATIVCLVTTTAGGTWDFLIESTQNLTSGSIPFATTGGFLTQDNANLFWDEGSDELNTSNLSVSGTINNASLSASELVVTDSSKNLTSQAAAALTKIDDTNVTLTLGGSPSTALVNAASLTLGWTGELEGSRGGTGVDNGVRTATYAGNLNFANSFQTIGNFSVIQRYTASTDVTFPASGTLATISLSSRTVTGNATLAATDNGGVVYCNSASAITITLPKQTTAALSAGFNCLIVNIGLGDVTVTHEAGDVFESPTLLIAQNAQMNVLLQTAGTPNTWLGNGGTLFFGEHYTVKFDGTAANGTYIVCGYLPADCVVIGAKFGCTSGTGTATSNLNGSNITNGALSITSATTIQSFTGNNTGSAGQILQVTLSSVSSLTNAWITFSVMRRL